LALLSDFFSFLSPKETDFQARRQENEEKSLYYLVLEVANPNSAVIYLSKKNPKIDSSTVYFIERVHRLGYFSHFSRHPMTATQCINSIVTFITI
jgi:hypothetical protein